LSKSIETYLSDHFVDHPLIIGDQLEHFFENRDLYPPTHNSLRPGPFVAMRSRQDIEQLLLKESISMRDVRRPSAAATAAAAAGQPNLTKADRRLRKTIASLPGMWQWVRDREDEIIKFALEQVHGNWQEVFERSRVDGEEWTTVRGDHETDDSEAESETAYVSTVDGKIASRRSSLSVRDVPEFLVWNGEDSFGRLVLHALARYYHMRSRSEFLVLATVRAL